MRRFKAMRRPLTLAWAMVLASALGAGAVHAQPSSPQVASSPNAGARADDLFKAGMSDVKQQKWVEAEAKFLAAFSLNRSYDIAANLGQTQYRLGKYREAAEHLAFAVKSWPIVGKREPREAAVKRLEELRKLVASVTVHVNVPGATVLVDGKEVGQAPLADEVFVDPGPRTIEVKLAGYKDAKQTVEAAKGSSQEARLALIASVPSEGPPGDSVPMNSARIWGRSRRSEESGLFDGKSPVWMGMGIGVAALGFGLGIGGAVASNNNAGTADSIRGPLAERDGPGACKEASNAEPCAELRSAFETSGTYRTVSIAGFSLAGAAVVGTLIYVLLPVDNAELRGVRASAVPLRGGGAAVVMGSF